MWKLKWSLGLSSWFRKMMKCFACAQELVLFVSLPTLPPVGVVGLPINQRGAQMQVILLLLHPRERGVPHGAQPARSLCSIELHLHSSEVG